MRVRAGETFRVTVRGSTEEDRTFFGRGGVLDFAVISKECAHADDSSLCRGVASNNSIGRCAYATATVVGGQFGTASLAATLCMPMEAPMMQPINIMDQLSTSSASETSSSWGEE
jgi:hypothetical protein